MKDAYDNLFEKYGREEFFKDSLEAIIFPESVEEQWKKQKYLLLNNGELFIRGYGRDAKKTEWFIELYKNLFQNNKIQKDSTNNAQPTKLLKNMTPYCKITNDEKNDGKERIKNYQVSHLFGKTKNPLLFNAAWNIAYIPKYLDPFTGHESQGEHRDIFKIIFEKNLKQKYAAYIIDYNNFIKEYVINQLEDALNKTRRELKITIKDFERFRSDAREALSEI